MEETYDEGDEDEMDEDEDEDDNEDLSHEDDRYSTIPTVMPRSRFEGVCNVETIKDGVYACVRLFAHL